MPSSNKIHFSLCEVSKANPKPFSGEGSAFNKLVFSEVSGICVVGRLDESAPEPTEQGWTNNVEKYKSQSWDPGSRPGLSRAT